MAGHHAFCIDLEQPQLGSRKFNGLLVAIDAQHSCITSVITFAVGAVLVQSCTHIVVEGHQRSSWVFSGIVGINAFQRVADQQTQHGTRHAMARAIGNGQHKGARLLRAGKPIQVATNGVSGLPNGGERCKTTIDAHLSGQLAALESAGVVDRAHY